jgi:4-amino-4-deoxy-L-arabinose transferase-like glycosyltransferase
MSAVLTPLDLDLDLGKLERSLRPSTRERVARGARRLLNWCPAHALDLGILAVLITVATIVHMHGMYDTPERFDDEGSYTAYAWAVQTEGLLNHYTYWYAHPPLGWIQIAFWNWLTDGLHRAPYAVASVRQLMVVSKIVSVILLYILALRLRMTRIAATAAVLIFALSPLAVYFTRTALLDNIVTPWLLAAFVLAVSPRRGLGAAVGSAACFAIAVLSKETVLLFLPALALLFWQHSDRRNRRFAVTLFSATLILLVSLYPAYALVKNELLPGKGHVSLLWAIKWQLFDRQGSGNVFNPHSTAHNVVSSWVIQDPWTSCLAVAALLPALLLRRTRAVALALGIQLSELLRSGYLPYPFVVAMIPFAALTIVGVVDAAWQRSALPLPWRRKASDARPGRFAITWRAAVRTSIAGATIALLVIAHGGWQARIHNLWHVDHDAGAAAALAWVRSNVPTKDRIVVDDAFWVDLVDHGYTQQRTIWFTKLDVDPAIRLPARPPWRAIDYIFLTYQDELSLHMTIDDQASPDTRKDFPTIGAALAHSQMVARFGGGADRVTIWRVLPKVAGESVGNQP